MFKSILKGVLNIGGNMLFPGAGSLASSVMDAAMPSEQSPINAQAQQQQGMDWGKIGGVAFGQVGQIAGDLFNKPSQDPMKLQMELAEKKRIMSLNEQNKKQLMGNLGGYNANI